MFHRALHRALRTCAGSSAPCGERKDLRWAHVASLKTKLKMEHETDGALGCQRRWPTWTPTSVAMTARRQLPSSATSKPSNTSRAPTRTSCFSVAWTRSRAETGDNDGAGWEEQMEMDEPEAAGGEEGGGTGGAVRVEEWLPGGCQRVCESGLCYLLPRAARPRLSCLPADGGDGVPWNGRTSRSRSVGCRGSIGAVWWAYWFSFVWGVSASNCLVCVCLPACLPVSSAQLLKQN